MASSVDTNLSQFKINSVASEEVLKQMEQDGLLEPNQIYMTPDEDVNLSQMRMSVLWTNLNPTSAFSAQTITLSSSDYDYLIFISDLFASSSIASQRNTVSMTVKGSGCSLNVSADYASNEATFYRTATYINDSQYNISGGSYRSNTTTGNDNSILVPIQVIGLKKQPAMIYTGTELHEGDGININDGIISADSTIERTEVIYFRTDSTKNWGYSGGLVGGVSVSGKDFSKYKYLIAYVRVLEVKIQVKIDLNYSDNGYVASGAGVSYLDNAIMSSRCTVNDSKDTFTVNSIGFYNTAGWNARNNNSSYFVYKIEGVY